MAVKQVKPVLAGHTAGIYADMTLDGPEIGTLVAVIDRAKNLPNRKTMGKQDPYCAMRLGKEAKKTDTDRRGGQTPKWDQELRFTVHESPDYYRLKCSIFNDDKKTDLIGEAWIDLSDLIKPGGGSNDLWHQLNYKGKYAGEVRIELTYYDLRPREEKIAERKKQREKQQTPSSDVSSGTSTPRQLGPREVRRRPLPASPAAATPVQTTPEPLPRDDPPPPPPKIPLDQPPRERSQPHPQAASDGQHNFDPYVVGYPAAQPASQPYRQPLCEDFSPSAEYQDEPAWDVVQHYQVPDTQMISRPTFRSLSQSDENVGWRRSDQPLQDQAVPYSEYHQMGRLISSPSAHGSIQPQFTSEPDTSPIKPTRYRDNSLRHSNTQQDVVMSMVEEPDTYDAPPPPPMHRETTPRRQQPDCPPSSFPQYDQSTVNAPRPLNITSRRRSVEERSPLQQIEHDFETHTMPQDFHHDSHNMQYSHKSYSESPPHQQNQSTRNDQYASHRHSFYDVLQGQNRSVPTFDHNNYKSISEQFPQDHAHKRPIHRERSGSYDDRRSNSIPFSSDDVYAMIPYTDSQLSPSQLNHHESLPARSRPRNSNPGQVPQRKAVSPAPYPQEDGRRSSTTPYGPDAYDALNPASSPVAQQPYSVQPNQVKESARMREVEKLRDQGPIIGNDGRVIDPSDHLPSDTWAPEPERKTRKPEHVIHYRTKNDTRSHGAAHASPVPARPSHPRQSPGQSSPISALSSGNRARIQKPAADRPLPVQPYQQLQPEPRFSGYDERGSFPEPRVQRSIQRYSYQDPTAVVHRPSLSEYQVPPTSSYTPRGPSHQDGFNSTPTRPQMHTGRDYNPRNSSFYDDDALAAEMSMIDIGPSRGGQMVLSRRAYS